MKTVLCTTQEKNKRQKSIHNHYLSIFGDSIFLEASYIFQDLIFLGDKIFGRPNIFQDHRGHSVQILFLFNFTQQFCNKLVNSNIQFPIINVTDQPGRWHGATSTVIIHQVRSTQPRVQVKSQEENKILICFPHLMLPTHALLPPWLFPSFL